MSVIGIPFGTTPAASPITGSPLSKWSVVTSPTDRPVSYASTKAHLRLEDDSEQDYVLELIDAATDYAQDAMNVLLLPQTIAAVFGAEDFQWHGTAGTFAPFTTSAVGSAGVDLPRGPVSSIVSVLNADSTAVVGMTLERTAIGDRLRFTTAAGPFPIVVTYTAGFPSAAAIPASIRQAIRAHVGSMYAMRESVSKDGAKVVPQSLEDFYRQKARRVPVG